MHAKKPVYLLVLPIAVMLACTNSNNPGTTGSNSMNTVEAGAPDGSPTVDKDVIPDLPIADVPIADAPDAAVCDQLAANARTQFESYLQITSSLACQVDSDCSLLGIQALNCVGGCGGPLVRTADISAVTAATANICVSAVRTPSFRTTAGSALLGAWQMRRRGANGSANTARAG
jgi:hypothetical protein